MAAIQALKGGTVIFGLATLWFVGIMCAYWILALRGRSAAEAVLVMEIILLIRSDNCKSYGESYGQLVRGKRKLGFHLQGWL
jgi:hypothetical protein